MDEQNRAVVYDPDLEIEAFYFEGMQRPFPSHFHPYYVFGLVEEGERRLFCNGAEYALCPGSVLLLNPGDSHACSQTSEAPLRYRGIRIHPLRMRRLQARIAEGRELPCFAPGAVGDADAACALRQAHRLTMERGPAFQKEEGLLLLLSLLLNRYAGWPEEDLPDGDAAVARACAFMERHYAWHISLEQLCGQAGLGRSSLLRAFARHRGMTPYNYLQNIRIAQAEKLLRQGAPPAEAALRTGFFDQSHFTHCFQRFIGLTPGVYREIFQHAPNRAAGPDGLCAARTEQGGKPDGAI